MNAIITTILSIAILIGLGYFFKRINLLSEKDVTPFNTLVMNLLMPCMIFSALYTADLSLISDLAIFPFINILSSFGTGAIAFIIFKALKLDQKTMWSVIVVVMIANTGFMGYPVNLGIYGQAGFFRAIFFDLGTTALFLILSFILIFKFGGSPKVAIKKILTFPVLWAVILGLIFNIYSIPIGPILDTTITYLGNGAIPLIMISLGVSIHLEGIFKNISMVGITSILKLIIFPLIALFVISFTSLTGLSVDVPIVEAAMPSGMLSLVLAITYKLDYRLTSNCILANTIFSLISLPIIIFLL
ncbi:MAG: AEC family transporter [Methanobrevibacter sp.]|nr:AEC family transporter [Methanobrevibacter sp.]